jgi:hypothetical protein
MLELKPEELASLPTIKAYWSHSHQDYDIWLSAGERAQKGLLWIFECQHGRWLLVGVPATVHGPDKKKWHQGVLKLPSQHKECQYRLYPETEWSLVEEDPLRHFDSAPVVKYRGLRWYYGDIDVYLKAVHTNYTATLFITLERKIAHVTFTFPNFQNMNPFETEYEKAVRTFHRLYKAGILEEDIPDNGLYNSYIPPNTALKAFGCID